MRKQNRREVRLIREAVDAVLSGHTTYSVTTRWNARGVTTANGRRWHPSNLKRLLVRPSLAGLRVHGPSGTTTQGAWTPVVTEQEHALLVARLATPPNAAPRVSRRTGLLSGLIRCGGCGKRLIHGSGERRYYCTRNAGGCGQARAHDGRALEAIVIDMSVAASKRTERETTETTAPDVSHVLHELTTLDERQAVLDDMLGRGDMDRAGYTRARQRILERRAELEEVLRETGGETNDVFLDRHDAFGRSARCT